MQLRDDLLSMLVAGHETINIMFLYVLGFKCAVTR